MEQQGILLREGCAKILPILLAHSFAAVDDGGRVRIGPDASVWVMPIPTISEEDTRPADECVSAFATPRGVISCSTRTYSPTADAAARASRRQCLHKRVDSGGHVLERASARGQSFERSTSVSCWLNRPAVRRGRGVARTDYYPAARAEIFGTRFCQITRQFSCAGGATYPVSRP